MLLKCHQKSLHKSMFSIHFQVPYRLARNHQSGHVVRQDKIQLCKSNGNLVTWTDTSHFILSQSSHCAQQFTETDQWQRLIPSGSVLASHLQHCNDLSHWEWTQPGNTLTDIFKNLLVFSCVLRVQYKGKQQLHCPVKAIQLQIITMHLKYVAKRHWP